MASFNKVYIMGNLTRDPELRVTANGLSICKFGLATTRHFSSQDGKKREETTFVDVDAFGRQAETLSSYMSKGRPIFIEGRLKFDQWESPSGEKRSKLGVVLESFQFIGARSDGTNNSDDKRDSNITSKPQTHHKSNNTETSSPDDDEDVPF